MYGEDFLITYKRHLNDFIGIEINLIIDFIFFCQLIALMYKIQFHVSIDNTLICNDVIGFPLTTNQSQSLHIYIDSCMKID